MNDNPTEAEFRKAGYTARAVNYPLSPLGCAWIAKLNGVDVKDMPRAWCYAPNQGMLDYIEAKARNDE